MPTNSADKSTFRGSVFLYMISSSKISGTAYFDFHMRLLCDSSTIMQHDARRNHKISKET